MGRSILGMSAAFLAALFVSPSTSKADSFYNNIPVTSGLLLRLDASNPGSINAGSPTNGVSVSSWGNTSAGAASNATQGTATRQPFWVSSVPLINNRSAVDFSGAADGTGDRLAVSSLNPGGSMTAFVVAQYQIQSTDPNSVLRPFFGPAADFPANGGYALTLNRGNNDAGIGAGNGLYAYRGSGTANVAPPPGPVVDNQFHIFVMRSTSALTEIFNNSTTAFDSAVLNPGETPSLTDYLIGGGTGGNEARHYDGQIAELLMYTGALTNAQIDQIGGFLAWKYGLTTSFSQFEPPATLTPEPGTCLLFGIAVLGAAVFQWRRVRARN